MDINQIKIFLKVSELESLSAAGRELFLTQQGVSYAISRLEHELNAQLFIRDKNGMHLTETGKQMLPLAKELCKCADAILTLCVNDDEVLRIAAQHGMSDFFKYDVITTFIRDYPNVRLELSTYDDFGVDEAVKNGIMDIGFSSGILSTDVFRVIPIGKAYFNAVVNKTHRLASRDSIGIKDLNGEKVCIGYDKYKYHHYFVQKCRENGFELMIDFAAPNPEYFHAYAVENLGISIVPSYINKRSQFENIVSIPIEIDDDYLVALIMRNKSNITTTQRLFIELVKNQK